MAAVRLWANCMGVGNNNASRPALARKLRDQAVLLENPPAPVIANPAPTVNQNEEAAANPRDVDVRELRGALDHVAHREWLNGIEAEGESVDYARNLLAREAFGYNRDEDGAG